MSSIIVDGSKVGLSKDLKVEKTFKNTKLCMKTQLKLAKVGQAIENFDEKNGQTLIDSLNRQIELLDGFVGFLKEILGLTKKKADELEEADSGDITDLVNEICANILGADSDKSED